MARPARRALSIAPAAFLAATLALSAASATWGFYAHREINRLAVFTVPDEVARFYKANLNYVSTHAVDPDKRRYAAPLEGPRHYIDMERFGDGRVASLPRSFDRFHDAYTTLYCVTSPTDSVELGFGADPDEARGQLRLGRDSFTLRARDYYRWYRSAVLPRYRREEHRWAAELPAEWPAGAPRCRHISLVDTMMEHGVLPYHLLYMQRRLTRHFERGELDRALQVSAEMGHYIGDATVPLHTTVNYNGQLTGQRGIHAFWESRIPELFAEAEFDLLVGSAEYVDDKEAFYFDLIEQSHALVDSVLLIEADLRAKLPEDVQDCYEERLGRIVRVPCRDFARAYYERLDGMVEERFRTAIRAVGSAWYTAWVDAGQPPVAGAVDEATLLPDTVPVVREGLDGRGH